MQNTINYYLATNNFIIGSIMKIAVDIMCVIGEMFHSK